MDISLSISPYSAGDIDSWGDGMPPPKPPPQSGGAVGEPAASGRTPALQPHHFPEYCNFYFLQYSITRLLFMPNSLDMALMLMPLSLSF